MTKRTAPWDLRLDFIHCSHSHSRSPRAPKKDSSGSQAFHHNTWSELEVFLFGGNWDFKTIFSVLLSPDAPENGTSKTCTYFVQGADSYWDRCDFVQPVKLFLLGRIVKAGGMLVKCWMWRHMSASAFLSLDLVQLLCVYTQFPRSQCDPIPWLLGVRCPVELKSGVGAKAGYW